MIDELQQIPNYVKQLKQEKSFVQAVSLLYHARQKTFQEEMLNLPFMDEVNHQDVKKKEREEAIFFA